MLDYLDIGKEIIVYILVHAILYLIFSFIAWDFNPMNWKVILDPIGRTVIVIIEIIVIAIIAGYDFDN